MGDNASLDGLRGDWRSLARDLIALGWRIERRTRHWFALAPDGVSMVALANSTERRAMKNTRAQLRRLGADL